MSGSSTSWWTTWYNQTIIGILPFYRIDDTSCFLDSNTSELLTFAFKLIFPMFLYSQGFVTRWVNKTQHRRPAQQLIEKSSSKNRKTSRRQRRLFVLLATSTGGRLKMRLLRWVQGWLDLPSCKSTKPYSSSSRHPCWTPRWFLTARNFADWPPHVHKDDK